MEVSQEKVYYEDEQVRVTNKRIVIGSKTYALKNISSVGVGVREPSTTFSWILIIVGLCIAAFGGVGSSVAMMIFGGVLAVIGIVVIASGKTEYAVKISSNSGEENGLISKDRDYVEKIVNAINDAIVS